MLNIQFLESYIDGAVDNSPTRPRTVYLGKSLVMIVRQGSTGVLVPLECRRQAWPITEPCASHALRRLLSQSACQVACLSFVFPRSAQASTSSIFRDRLTLTRDKRRSSQSLSPFPDIRAVQAQSQSTSRVFDTHSCLFLTSFIMSIPAFSDIAKPTNDVSNQRRGETRAVFSSGP